MTNITVVLPEKLYTKLCVAADHLGCSELKISQKAIDNYVADIIEDIEDVKDAEEALLSDEEDLLWDDVTKELELDNELDN